MDLVRAHIIIAGRVQGVGFREATRRRAEMRAVTGWVQNRTDGGVEALFEGEEPDVRSMVEWCHRGPPAARVSGIDVSWQQATGEFDSFDVRLGYSW